MNTGVATVGAMGKMLARALKREVAVPGENISLSEK